ncbi:hypothetical protein [Streptomyces sp. SID9727]|nr:hypothetical protein [Streptomyces sp. SID9727]NEC66304.1 hypothetical protein [Streptomyces sp. SID9727]
MIDTAHPGSVRPTDWERMIASAGATGSAVTWTVVSVVPSRRTSRHRRGG